MLSNRSRGSVRFVISFVVFAVPFLFIFFLFSTYPALARELPNPLGAIKEIPGLINRILKGFFGVIGAVSLGMFIYGGILWLFSMGDEARVKKGWDTMIWSTFGLGMIFSSYAIVSFLLLAITGPWTPSAEVTRKMIPPSISEIARPPVGAPAAEGTGTASVETVLRQLCREIGGSKYRNMADDGSCPPGYSLNGEFLQAASPTLYSNVEFIGIKEKKFKSIEEYTKSVGSFNADLLKGPGQPTLTDIFTHGAVVNTGYELRPLLDPDDRLRDYKMTVGHEGGHNIGSQIQYEMAKQGRCNASDYHDCEGIYIGNDGGVSRGLFLQALPLNLKTRRDLEPYVPQSIIDASNKGMEGFKFYFGHEPIGKKVIFATPEGDQVKDAAWLNNQMQNNSALMLLDEMAQYTTGGRVIIDEQKRDPSKYGYFYNGDIAYAVELVPINLALAVAVAKDGGRYLTHTEPQFPSKLQVLIERAVEGYSIEKNMYPDPGTYVNEELKKRGRPGIDIAENMLETLRTSEDAQELRDLARLWYGSEWTSKWLGFE